jgi:hypothetical protein
MGSSYGQSTIRLSCEGLGAKWEVTVALDMQAIFTRMQVGGGFTTESTWKIVQSGDRFIRGDFINVDKETKKPSVSDKMSVLIDRYNSKLLWGNLSDDNKTPLPFDCVKVDRKF